MLSHIFVHFGTFIVMLLTGNIHVYLGVLKHRFPEIGRFCNSDLPMYTFLILGSHVAQLVGCWTHKPRVVGSVSTDANFFMWDNILG